MICPGCGRAVPVLEPRPPGGRRPARPWRRRAHAVTGDLGGGYQGRRSTPPVRCRYPLTLSADEIAATIPEGERTCA
jgi:hypothetical protein